MNLKSSIIYVTKLFKNNHKEIFLFLNKIENKKSEGYNKLLTKINFKYNQNKKI